MRRRREASGRQCEDGTKWVGGDAKRVEGRRESSFSGGVNTGGNCGVYRIG